MPPLVVIVILNWNGINDTLECLKSVYNLKYSNFVTIVLDNGSLDTDSALRINLMFPKVIVLCSDKNLGFAGGNNLVLKNEIVKSANYVWLLNNDTVVEVDVLNKLVMKAEEDNSIGMVSPVIHFYDNRSKVQFCGSIIDWKTQTIRQLADTVAYQETGADISLWGTALLIKTTVINKIGYFGEHFFAYCEDEDYSLRSIKAGFKNVVHLEARIYHKNSKSTGSPDAPIQMFLRLRNRYFLWRDKTCGLRAFAFTRRYLSYTIATLASASKGGKEESIYAGVQGVWAAFRGISGPYRPELKPPTWFLGLFRFCCSFHPYFWCLLVGGDIQTAFKLAAKRLFLLGRSKVANAK